MFGYKEKREGGQYTSNNWPKVLAGMNEDIPELECSSSSLSNVNSFVNNLIEYKSDKYVWNDYDYWATPRQIIDKGKGDCEDFAILKYYILRKKGYSNLKILVVKDIYKRIHAVLVVRHKGSNYILDNNMSMAFREKYIKNYKPLYAIAANSWYSYHE